MTPFSCLCRAAGLTLPAVSVWLDVRLDTARSWSSGRRTAPADVLGRLMDLVRHQEAAARETADVVVRGSDHARVVAPVDDEEARVWGYPDVATWGAMLGRAMAMADDRIDVVAAEDLP